MNEIHEINNLKQLIITNYFFKDARQKEEFKISNFSTGKDMFRWFQDGHCCLISPSIPSKNTPILKQLFWFENNLYAVFNIFGKAQLQCGQIDQVQNQSLGYRVSQEILNYPQASKSLILSWIIEDIVKENLKVSFKNIIEIDRKRVGHALMNNVSEINIIHGCFCCKITEKTAYIKLFHFSSIYCSKDIQDFLDNGTYKMLVIDIRNGLGGKVTIAQEVLSLFTLKDIEFDYTVNSRDAIFARMVKKGTTKMWNIKILINRYTRSSMEFIFLYGLLRSGQSIITFGEKTFGLSGQAKEFIMGRNKILLTNRRYLIEGKEIIEGISPVVIMESTFHDFVYNEDSLLTEVLEYCE